MTDYYFDRLKEATTYHQIERDGKKWYSAWHVCTALQYNYKTALRMVLADDKLTTHRMGLRGIRNATYFSPRGVEAVIMLKGGLPRKHMLEALA